MNLRDIRQQEQRSLLISTTAQHIRITLSTATAKAGYTATATLQALNCYIDKDSRVGHNRDTHIETFALFIEENPFEKGFPPI